MPPEIEAVPEPVAAPSLLPLFEQPLREARDAFEKLYFEYHLRRSGIRALFDPPMPDDEGYQIGITKLVMSTNDKTQALLDGEMW